MRLTPAGVSAIAPLSQSAAGGSGSFLVRADDGRRYWCKVVEGPQGARVPVNEQIVGRLGRLIGASTCDVELVYIPAALAGWQYRAGLPLAEGWAHGSLAVDPCVETRVMDDRSRDDNARRHAGIYAIFDWAGGQDPQWLTRGSEREYFSHDHGHFFPGGPDWTIAGLQVSAANPHALGVAANGLDAGELRRLADAIEGVSVQEIESCAAKIPPAWPVADAELEAAVTYLTDRRGSVADRLRALAQAV